MLFDLGPFSLLCSAVKTAERVNSTVTSPLAIAHLMCSVARQLSVGLGGCARSASQVLAVSCLP